MGDIPLHIFVADDDEDDILLFKEAAEQLQMKSVLTIFRQGKEVCEFIQDSLLVPDIIFLDINMPFMNGKDCLVALRKDKRFSNTPIIMYSTSATETDIEESFKRGANLYVQKAFTFSNLKRMLEQVLNRLSTNRLAQVTYDKFVFKYER